jgi:hypothetical protein
MMRGPGDRSRSMALALLLVCVGAVSYEPPPIPVESEGEFSFVLADAAVASALPALSWTIALDRSAGTSPKHGQGREQASAPDLALVPFAPRDPRAPSSRPHQSGAALLGLLTAPANAPPGFLSDDGLSGRP